MPHLSFHRPVDAPRDVLWDVISNHELYATAAPNLRSVDVVQDEAEPFVRRCTDTAGNEWTETCTLWEPGRRFAVSVDVGGSDFHRRLFSRFEGAWGIEESADGLEFRIEFDFEPRYGPLGVIISWYLRRRAPSLIEVIFDRWEAEIETRCRDESSGGPESTNGTVQGRTDARSP